MASDFDNFKNKKQGEALKYLFEWAKKKGYELTWTPEEYRAWRNSKKKTNGKA